MKFENKLNEIISNQLMEYRNYKSYKDSDCVYGCEFKCSKLILDKLISLKRELNSIKKYNPNNFLNSMKNTIKDELKEYKEYINKPSDNCNGSNDDCKYIRYTTELISLRNIILRNKQ